jgi:hypothetical protein
MDNINNEKKPQNKKFSLFCCFCANDERRKRRAKKYKPNSISITGIKTNISFHSNINVRQFPEDNSKNKNSLNKPILDNAKNVLLLSKMKTIK